MHSIRKTLLTLTNREISIDNIEKKLVMFFQIRVEVKMKEWTQMKTIWKMEKNLSRVTRNKLWMMTVLKKLSKKRKEDE